MDTKGKHMDIVDKLDKNDFIIRVRPNKNKSNGATSRNALILFFFSAFFRLTSKGIPSVVKICFVSELIKK